MKKIALVNHRYGLEVTGGSELHCRLLAEQLQKKFDVEVITTCAIDDNTWANYYPEGEQLIEDIFVRRFPVVKERDWYNYDSLANMVDNPYGHRYEEEIQWVVNQGPYSPALFDFLHTNYEKYDAIIFMTYLYYTSAICMLGIPNAIFLPTAHDEKAIYLKHYDRVFKEPKAMIYNTEEEKELLTRRFPWLSSLPSMTGVYGIQITDNDNDNALEDIPVNYILYAGRITESKGCAELFDFFIRYKKEYPSDLKLVLLGKKDMDIPIREDIVFKGFVSDETKMIYMRNAKAFVLASHFESLSMVVLESMSVETPVLVTRKCKVLDGHILKSDAGFSYDNFEEFARNLNVLCTDEECNKRLGKNGKNYVQNNYSWEKVIASLQDIVDKLGFDRTEKEVGVCNSKVYYNRIIEPIYGQSGIPIILAADDNYACVLAVAIQSIIDTADINNKYDIIIFSDKISETNREMLLLMAESYENISIRFIEVGLRLDKYNFEFTNVQLSRATFMRLFIPELLRNYSKVIYMDCDMIIRNDISELYKIDLEGNMIGAVRDAHIMETSKFRDEVKDYILNELKLHSTDDYFNAGLLLIDVRELCSEYTSDKLFELATSRRWMWEDQCVLNYISNGRVKYLDFIWNLFWVECPRIEQMMLTNVEYRAAFNNPKILHYCSGAMPINRINDRYSYIWWNSARKTPFYEMLIKRMSGGQQIVNVTNSRRGFLYKKIYGMKRNIKDFGYKYTLELLFLYFKSLAHKRGKRLSYLNEGIVTLRKKYHYNY